MLQEIYLLQPMAIARTGASPHPLDAYEWGPNDLRPQGSGRTTIRASETLLLDDAGHVSSKPPGGEILFKDLEGRIRPVCPFFELHARGDDGEGPLTAQRLAAHGLRPADLVWRVELHNHKAFHWTQAPSDKVTAALELPGDDTARHALRGVSVAAGGHAALVPDGRFIPMGYVQLTRPNDAFPEFRLRFTPGPGSAYGPANLAERVRAAVQSYEEAADPNGHSPYAALLQDPFVRDQFRANLDWRDFTLPAENCFLDPQACWPNFALFSLRQLPLRYLALLPNITDLSARLAPQMSSELLRLFAGPEADLRNLPPGLFGWAVDPPDKLLSSMGLADDLGDGLITCSLRLPGAGAGADGGATLTARARIIAAPPIWAPDRRPVTNLADGLTDRSDRSSVRAPGYALTNFAEVDAAMRDLLDRAFETVGLANMDVLDAYFQKENALRGMRPASEYSVTQAAERLWTGLQLVSVQDLPLTAAGRDRHRRNAADLFFDAFLIKHDDFMERYVRTPAGPERLYDRRMPGLMRGADRRPLTLTRRQYDLLAAWVDAVRARAQADMRPVAE